MPGPAIPDRVRFAIECIDLKPGEKVLEAGGGSGVAARLACDAVGSDGHVTMVDRSAVAVRRCKQNSREFVAAGRLSVAHSELADFVGDSVDVFFCVDVNVFWTSPATAELTSIERALSRGGRVAIVYGVGPNRADDDRRATVAAERLAASGFAAVETRFDARGSAAIARLA